MSVRQILRSRGRFMLILTAVLATSGGLNLAVFALVNALWLRPVPVKDADRLFVISSPLSRLTLPVFSTFEGVAGQVAGGQNQESIFRFADQSQQPEVMGVSSGYFRLLGLNIRGRDFTDDDDRDGAELVAVISDQLWADAFGRRPDVVGHVVGGDPVSVRVIGVAPPGFQGAQRGERTDIWVPRATYPRMLRLQPGATPLSITVWIRLRVGDTAAAAETRLNKNFQPAISLMSISELYGTPASRSTLLQDGGATRVVAGLALLVLFGGFAALASLLLVHFERRRLEFSIKASLGASAGQVTRSILCELGMIGIAGAVGALVVGRAALGGLAMLRLHLPAGVDLTRLDLSFDWRVLMTGLALTMLTLLVAALLPLSRLTHRRLVSNLSGGPTATASVASQRLRQALLGLLVSATAIVLVSATLFTRSVHSAYVTSPGFDVDHTLFASVPVSPFRTYLGLDYQGQRVRMVRESLRAVPGVHAVAIGSAPISETMARQVRESRAFRTRDRVHDLRVGRMIASPDALAALGVPIVSGRDLAASDLGASPAPMVVTETLAQTLWPADNPLGQLLGDNYYVVVGVARDFAFGSLADRADGVTVVARDDYSATAQFILRTRVSSASLVDEVRRVLGDVLRDTPAATVMTGREALERDVGRQRLGAWFFSAFGLVALGVGVGSVFGMVAYLAESRRREFGVRLALGASHRNVLWHGMRTALMPVCIGLAVGLVAAAALSRTFDAMLVGITRFDLMTYVAVAAVLIIAASAASLLAAWRLRRVAPVEVLRSF